MLAYILTSVLVAILLIFAGSKKNKTSLNDVKKMADESFSNLLSEADFDTKNKISKNQNSIKKSFEKAYIKELISYKIKQKTTSFVEKIKSVFKKEDTLKENKELKNDFREDGFEFSNKIKNNFREIEEKIFYNLINKNFKDIKNEAEYENGLNYDIKIETLSNLKNKTMDEIISNLKENKISNFSNGINNNIEKKRFSFDYSNQEIVAKKDGGYFFISMNDIYDYFIEKLSKDIKSSINDVPLNYKEYYKTY